MGFNLESRKNNEINEVPDNQVNSEKLLEIEETAENFDDCSLGEVKNENSNEVNSKTLEGAEDEFEDCKVKLEDMEEEHPELADDDSDDFDDCEKETAGEYVVEVTYTTDGEISHEEAKAEIQEAYNECENPENMAQLKENTNEKAHIEVVNAEVVERPDETTHHINEAEYEEAKREYEDAQEHLEEQQEAAKEYEEKLEEKLENTSSDDENAEVADFEPEDTDGSQEKVDSEVDENADNELETGENVIDEEQEQKKETDGIDTEDDESNEIKENKNDPSEVDKSAETETHEEVLEESDDVSDQPKETDDSGIESNSLDVEESVDGKELSESGNRDKPEDEIDEGESELTSDEIESLESDDEVEVEQIDQDELTKDNIKTIEEEAGTELSKEAKEELVSNLEEKIEDRADDGTLEAEEAQEAINEQIEEKVDTLEIAKEAASEEITESAEAVMNSEDNLSEDEIKEKVEEDTFEDIEQTDLDEVQIGEIIEEKSEVIDEIIEEEQEDAEHKEEVEEVAEGIEAEEEVIKEEKQEKSLGERIDFAFDKDYVTSSEVGNLAAENAEALNDIKKEQSEVEIEMSKKFDGVMSMKRGTDEYKQALQEYNDLKDKKEELDEKVTAFAEQQERLEKKSLELREAQISRGEAAVVASATTLASAKALEGRFDEEYYSSKSNRTELGILKEDNSAIIKELSEEKTSLKLAMDAKMDQISDYIILNNMGRYETSGDPYYKQMSQEYLSLKSTYDSLGYSIVKLDENNMHIAEVLGDEYISMRELPPSSAIIEVAQGNDIPRETNYFIDEVRTSEVLAKFNQEKWENLTLREQKQAVEQLADFNAEILGVEEKPRIVYYRKEDISDFGGYSSLQNAIYINEYNMTDAAETADTISHEYRHKYQHERAEKLENERDLAFKESFDDYIRAEDDYYGYMNQLVEVDARDYADVIKGKIDSYSGTTEVNKENSLEYEGKIDSFAENNPEKGAVWDSENMFSRKFLKVNENEVRDESILDRTFLTNDGERITYDEAVNRITASAANYMASMNVDETVEASVIADMKEELIKQHIEAESRGLGDHGIRHIYGNFERGENYLMSRVDVSDEQKLAVLVSQVYHDEGYTTAPNNFGTLKEGNSDKKHDETSLTIWHEAECQDIYKDVFSQESIESIEVAIGKHNASNAEEIKTNTAFESDPVVSTVHICDKLALSQREKFSELLSSNPKLVELTEGMNSTAKMLQNEKFGFYENGRLTDQGAELLEQYHREINAYIDSQEYDSEYATRLKTAVKKDVGFNSGKFSSRMNYIYTPSDCYQYNADTGKNEIKVYTIVRPDSVSSDIASKQVEKMFEDLGLSGDELQSAIAKGEYDFGEERGLYVRVEPITEDEVKAIESAHYQENNDLKEVNERIENGRAEYNKLTNKLTEIVELKHGNDITYNDFRKITLLGNNTKYLCTKEGFDKYSPSEKESIIKKMISDTVLERVYETLH